MLKLANVLRFKKIIFDACPDMETIFLQSDR